MASSSNYGSTYRKARAQWKAGLGPRPQCWLCGRVIDIDLHHYSKDSFELDHYYPVSEYPHLANDPQWFRPAHKKCNASRKAHGWSSEEFKLHNTSVLNDSSVDSSLHSSPSIASSHNTLDSMQLAIDLNSKTASSSAASVPAVPVDSPHAPIAKRNSISTKNAKKEIDPQPALVSRDWNHDCPTVPCAHCREFGRVRRMEYNAWLDRHPRYKYA